MRTDSNWTANPSVNGLHWFVWDAAAGLPPQIIYWGTMEAAQEVADAMQADADEGGRGDG